MNAGRSRFDVILYWSFCGGLVFAPLSRAEAPEPCASAHETEPAFLNEAGSGTRPDLPAAALHAIAEEAKRYVQDAGALVAAPLHWNSADAKKAIGFGLVLGGLLLADREIYEGSQRSRSDFTDEVSRVTSDFGGPYAYAISGGLLVAGLAARNPELRDTGREALEAAVLAGLITNILKPVFGRERPSVSGGDTVFAPFSGNKSFPSGHATTAFAVASVIAMRTDGWVVPTLAYALAVTVAMDRVNDRAHFASDVFAGAAIGLTTGRFLVHRHRRAARAEAPLAEIDLVPIRSGLAARVRY